jgi:hypothetical protein
VPTPWRHNARRGRRTPAAYLPAVFFFCGHAAGRAAERHRGSVDGHKQAANIQTRRSPDLLTSPPLQNGAIRRRGGGRVADGGDAPGAVDTARRGCFGAMFGGRGGSRRGHAVAIGSRDAAAQARAAPAQRRGAGCCRRPDAAALLPSLWCSVRVPHLGSLAMMVRPLEVAPSSQHRAVLRDE